MPVPSAITELSQTAASNYPAGNDSPATLDDVQRAHASFIALLRDGKGRTNRSTLASASTTDIGGQNSLFVEVTGTTTITSLGTSYNGPRYVKFSGALTLTHNATLMNLLGGANIITAAGDFAVFIPNTAVNGWDMVMYQRASGVRVSVKDFGAVGDGVADDTAAFVAAMAASKNIFVPAGIYNITGITFSNDQTITGDGYATEIRTSGTLDFPSVRKGGIRKCKVTLTQSSITLLDFRKTGSAGSFELYFEDVVFTGSTSLTNTIGAKFTDSYINTFVNCHFIWFDKAIQFNTEAHRNNFFGCTVRSSLTYGTVLVESNAGYANSFTGCDLENCSRILDMNGGMVAFGEGCYFEAHNAAFGFQLAGGHASFHQCYFNEVFFRLQSGGSLDLSRNWIKASSLSTAIYPVIRTLSGYSRLILDNNTLQGVTYLARFDPTVYNLMQVYDEGTSSWSGAYPSASTHLAINDFVYDVTAASIRHVSASSVRASRSLSSGYTEGDQRFDGGSSGVQLVSSNWNYNPLRLGAYYLWVDATGDLRIKSGAPTFDTDGSVVGTQS